MHNLEIYILKSVLIGAIYYLFYWLFLRTSTFYKLNRTYILLALAQMVLLPLFRIESQLVPIGNPVTSTLSPIIISADTLSDASTNSLSILQIFLIIYISGITFLVFRFFNNLARIIFFYFRFPKTNYKGYKTVVLEGDQSSFTFFNTLFISETDLNNDTNEVVLHELAHRRQLHSMDSIIIELIVIFQWYNPFVWLLQFALRSQHEYSADKYVLEKGHDLIGYQQLLFERAIGFSPLVLINHFNHSLLKKRITMMTKNKSKAWQRLHYWVSIPLMLITVMLFIVQPDIIAQENDVLMHDQVEEMPEYPGGIPAIRKHIAENITYPESAKASKLSAKIFVSFVVDEKGKVTRVKVERSDVLENINGEIVVVGYEPEKDAEIDPEAMSDLENEAIRVVQTIRRL